MSTTPPPGHGKWLEPGYYEHEDHLRAVTETDYLEDK